MVKNIFYNVWLLVGHKQAFFFIPCSFYKFNDHTIFLTMRVKLMVVIARKMVDVWKMTFFCGVSSRVSFKRHHLRHERVDTWLHKTQVISDVSCVKHFASSYHAYSCTHRSYFRSSSYIKSRTFFFFFSSSLLFAYILLLPVFILCVRYVLFRLCMQIKQMLNTLITCLCHDYYYLLYLL